MFWLRHRLRMLKRKLQDLTVCCTYKTNLLHNKVHGSKEFRKQYRLIEEMGRGGFGVVYQGERISDNLPVAIKFIRHKNVREWTMTNNQLLPSELVHLETCRDVRGVIGLIDWFANSKGFLIVMERPAECMDLFDLVTTHGRLDETTAQGIFLQIVDTVCSMYAQHGIVHRDIKDENLIVDMKTGIVKLVDFGAAAHADRAIKKEFQGTRSYCPPEWFRRLEYLPLEATSWSLGVLLYILLTGNLPFRNEIQICLGRINYPSYLSKEVISLLRRCLSTFPGNRASLVEIRQHSWLQKTIPTHVCTFKEALDQKLCPRNVDRSPRRRNEDSRQASEEMLLEKMMLSERQPRRLSRLSRASTRTANDESPTRSLPRDGSSLHSMHTCLESVSTGLPRMHSRYDNVSASSLADYISITSADTRADTLSMATACPYFSASDFPEDTDDDGSVISDFCKPTKSGSTHSLTRLRRRSLIARSFDRELGTLHEAETAFHDPMTSSQISTTSTLVEETKKEPHQSPSPSPVSSLRPLLSRPTMISRIPLLNNQTTRISAN
ncbi:unnamed protein product, partial [Mesorhabditis belari]|uniref:Serine/threonine-protein kinase 1 n=1 Tax=Mesorhabditis belari TaxID=2138241 RepID=A0AAF3E9Y2_9BILA